MDANDPRCRMEPGISHRSSDIDEQIMTSIAISLKRIADALVYRDGPENLFDYIRMIAESRGG